MQENGKRDMDSRRRGPKARNSGQNRASVSDSMRRFEGEERGGSTSSSRSRANYGKPSQSQSKGGRGSYKKTPEDHFWISGRNPVLESLRAGLKATQLLIREKMSGKVTELIRKEAERRGVPIAHRSGADMDRLLHHTDHRGVALRLERIQLPTLDSFLKQQSEEKMKSLFLLLLDGLQDPQNLGAIARTAEVAGVDAIVLPNSSRAPLSDASFRASAGALAWIPLLEVPFLEEALQDLGERGLARVGLEERLGTPYHEAELDRPIALVVGGEGRGLSKATIEKLDMMLKIPMQGRVGSLNASVAAAIMVYQVLASDSNSGQQ